MLTVGVLSLQWPAVLLLLLPLLPLLFCSVFFVFFFPFLLLFSLFFAIRSSPLSSPLSFLFLSALLSLSPVSFFLLLLPYFYRQKQGRGMAGAANVLPPLHHPSNTWKVFFWKVGLVGVFLKGSRRLFEGRDGGDRGRKNLLLPLLRTSRGRRKVTVSFKTAPFSSFVLFF